MPTDPQKDNLLTYTDAGGVGRVLLEPMELASHPSPSVTCPVDTHSKDAFRNAPGLCAVAQDGRCDHHLVGICIRENGLIHPGSISLRR